jgi:hypothetical protein
VHLLLPDGSQTEQRGRKKKYFGSSILMIFCSVAESRVIGAKRDKHAAYTGIGLNCSYCTPFAIKLKVAYCLDDATTSVGVWLTGCPAGLNEIIYLNSRVPDHAPCG